jgi:hypothetical protein
MSCFVMDSHKGFACTMWFRQITKYDTKNDAHPHSTEQDTQPISSLISKQAVPYWTHGGSYCPEVSTHFLADSSTTSHDCINHLHHSNRGSNHSIGPHMAKSHLDGWKTITLSQRMKNLHDTHD